MRKHHIERDKEKILKANHEHNEKAEKITKIIMKKQKNEELRKYLAAQRNQGFEPTKWEEEPEFNSKYTSGKSKESIHDEERRKVKKEKQKSSKINTLDVINIDEELLASVEENVKSKKDKSLKDKPKKKRINIPLSQILSQTNKVQRINDQEGTSLMKNKSPFSAKNSQVLMEDKSKEKSVNFGDIISQGEPASPTNKSNIKSFKKSQIKFTDKNNEKGGIKQSGVNLQESHKYNMSFNNTNDTSIPEERLKLGLLSGKIFNGNSTSRDISSDSKQFFQ